MALAQIYKGGTPVTKYGFDRGDPILYQPPFARKRDFWTKDDNRVQPPFNAYYNGAAGSFAYPAGQVLAPRHMEWQYHNLKYADITTNDVLQMVPIPANYWIDYVRFDVCRHDPSLAGMTAEISAMRWSVDPANPANNWVSAEDPFFHAAAGAQGIAPIPLDTPSCTILSLVTIANVAIDATAPGGGGAVTVNSVDGFVKPYHVMPEFITDTTVTPPRVTRYETGSLILGIKLLSAGTVKLWEARHDFYLTTRIYGFQSLAYA